jgi:hypothetical protein
VAHDLMAEWEARGMAAHEAEVINGLHDDECEYGRTLKKARLLLCNCSKRRRESAGYTTPPDEDLYFRAPDCPRCDSELDHDGDSFNCYECCLSWDSNGAGGSCSFTDDFGDLSGSEAPDAIA